MHLQVDEPNDPLASRPAIDETPAGARLRERRAVGSPDAGEEPEDDPLASVRPDERPAERTPEERAREQAARFLQTMREQFRESADMTSELRARIVADRKFAGGGKEQWMVNGVDLQAARFAQHRPAHTVNRIPGFVKQVTNGIRESRLAIEYIPVDDSADPKRAEVFQGLARHVEQNSDCPADVAYETAMEHQVEGGLGWFFARTYFVHDMTDEQDILIDRVPNPLTVYWDPTCRRFDFSDGRYLFVVEDLPLDTYRRLYGKDAPIASLEDFSSIGDRSNWLQTDRIRVVEYYYIEYATKRLVMVLPAGVELQPNQPIPVDSIEKKFLEDLTPEELPRVATMGDGAGQVQPIVLRTVQVPTVKWAKCNGLGIIEGETDPATGIKIGGRRVPGKYIPYAPVIGDERNIDGEVDYRGMVRDLRDAQQMVNFWQSAITEAIALAPKSPYVISAGQIKNFEGIWSTANNVPHAYLPYNAQDIGGHLVPPPQRNVLEPAIQAMVVALQIAENHLRALAGFYDIDPRESKKSEQSGRAILARQQQGERGNSNFHGNLARAIRHMGRILLHMFPEVYDTARVKRIVGEDEKESTVQVYSGAANKPAQPKINPKTKQPIEMYDLSDPRYDVRTSVGPSYPTRRAEGFDKLMELSKVHPQVAAIGADIIVSMLDAPGARPLADRLKKLPHIAQLIEDDGADPQVENAKLKAQLEQLDQLAKLLTQELNAKSAVLETDQAKYAAEERIKLLELKSKEAIELQKQQLEIVKIQLQAQGEERMTRLQAELDRLGKAIELALAHGQEEYMARVNQVNAKEQMALQGAIEAQNQPTDPAAVGGGTA